MLTFQIPSRLVERCAACVLRCTFLWVSITLKHTIIHRSLVIKIIIVKFHLKITTLKMLSDCFGIKRSRKRPTDCSLRQVIHIYYPKCVQMWKKIRNFSHPVWWIENLQNVGTSGHFLACTILRTSFCLRPTFGRLHHNPKKRKYPLLPYG